VDGGEIHRRKRRRRTPAVGKGNGRRVLASGSGIVCRLVSGENTEQRMCMYSVYQSRGSGVLAQQLIFWTSPITLDGFVGLPHKRIK
jgi:hypothetical protein